MVTEISFTGWISRKEGLRTFLLLSHLWLFGSIDSHAETWTLTPSVAATETFSSNMTLSSAAPQSGLVTGLDPSIVLSGNGSHLKVHADLTISNVDYSGHPEWTVHQNKLTSYATLEAVDNWLFIDASANIGHRNQSSFAPVAINLPVAGQTQVETRSTQLSPYIRGTLLNTADYVVRVNNIDNQSDDPNFANTTVTQYTGALKKSPTGGSVGWFTDLDAMKVNNAIVGQRADDRYRVGILFPLIENMNASVSAGQESTDFSSTSPETTFTPGLGIEWTPSPRFQLAAAAEQRFFGTAHHVQISQSTPLAAWRFLATRDVSVFTNLLTGYNPGSINNLISELLVASIPDPTERALAVRNRMQQIGAAANLTSTGGSDSSRFYIDQIQEASLALKFRRDTLTFMLLQRVQQLLSLAPVAVDIFTASGGVEEKSFSASWVHRATPDTELIGSAVFLKTQGQSAPFLESQQTSFSLSTVHRVNRTVSASIGVRRTAFDGGASTILDNAVFVSLGKQF